MKHIKWMGVIFSSIVALSLTASAQSVPFEIVSRKIGVEYYPMLDRPSGMAAESADPPRTMNDEITRQNRRRIRMPPDELRSRGRLRSYTRVIDNAEQITVVLKNTAEKKTQLVAWDFAFPRYEEGKLLARFDVSTKIEIKPGGQKTLKFKLPPGAKRCEVVKVVGEEKERVETFEAVCGQGFHDPSLLGQTQETISIKRIEYTDGTVWEKP